MDTARTGQYIPVRSLIGKQTTRYWVVPPIGVKKREKNKENLESDAALPILIRHLRVISSPRAGFLPMRGEESSTHVGRRIVYPRGEKKRGYMLVRKECAV
ncbi:hypothetical protein BHM03_00017861 [Ensete ventricosum]|nr:hypothetical protein BHM03_00017861 [Ensete ventricosum]